MATSFLNFCMANSGLDLALGAAGFEFAAGVGSMYTWSSEGAIGSGLFWGWSVDLLGSSTAFVSLPSSVNKAMIPSWFSLGKTTSHISKDSANPSDNSIKFSISS